MGIHVHVKGKPDMCRCCAIVDRLNELWDRTHNSVLSVNGIYADGNGDVLIPGIQDISDLREEVRTLEVRVTNDRTYLEAVAEDVAEIGTLVPSLATLNTEQTFTAAKYLSVIGANATAIVNKDWIWQTAANADNGLLHRTGDEAKAGSLELNNGSLYADSPTAWTGSANFDGKGIAFRDSGNNTLIALFPRVTNGKCKLMYAQKVASGNIEYHELIS